MKGAPLFRIKPCAPAVMTCASVIELDAVANSIGVSWSSPRSIRHNSSPVREVVIQEVEVKLLSGGLFDGIGHTVGRCYFVVFQQRHDQLTGVGVVVNAENLFFRCGQ